jgi:hypothetical protein
MFVILQGIEMIAASQCLSSNNYQIAKLLNGILILVFIQISNNDLEHNMRMHNFRAKLSISWNQREKVSLPHLTK